MTVVVAVECDAGVWLGCDSFAGTAESKTIVDTPKWFCLADVVFAYSGSFRAAQVVESSLKARKRRKNETPQRYIALIANAIRAAHGGEIPEADGTLGFSMLIVCDGKIYMLQSDYSVIRSAHRYAAIGAGDDFALGSLASTSAIPAEERVNLALDAAIKHSPSVCGPKYTTLVKG